MAANTHYFSSGTEVSIDTFAQICDRNTNIKDYPLAAAIEKNIVIYDGDTLRNAIGDAQSERDIKNELHHCLKGGPGVFAVTGFFDDLSAVDASTRIFEQIIVDEKAARGSRGDHFAPADSNARIWNSLQKVCYASPDAFVDYYGNPLFALINEAWLGPGYQLTAQVNVVRPGGQAQIAHRDYHFGFQSEDMTARFPVTLQVASQYLTLQGAIAHTDMPLESGPTLLLPYSQRYNLGYLAYRYDEFRRYFDASAVQLPLHKGDALFLSPALFHAAGANRTENFERMANLIQTSAAFGKPMESVNRVEMAKRVYPVLLRGVSENTLSPDRLNACVAAVADGYAFPTNLDVVVPLGGNSPETVQQLMLRALAERWPAQRFDQELSQQAEDRQG